MDASKPSIDVSADEHVDAKPTAKRIVNPYAVKRSSKSSKAPRNDVVRTTCENDPPKNHAVLTAKDAPATKDVFHATEKPVNDQSSKLIHSSKKTSKTKSYGNLPPWQRLPSQNVSFTSAEILTVSELREHSLIYSNRSVRITGVLMLRLALEGHLALVVGDVVAGARPPPARRNPLLNRNPYSATARRGGGGLGSATKTPLVKRKLVHRPTPARQSSLLKTPATRKKPLLGRKGILSTPKTAPTSIESVVSCLFEQPSVLVLANPTHVQTNDCGVGDLVMVMGEVGVYTAESENANNSPLKPLLEKMLEQQVPADVTDQKVAHYLQARILRNTNGTDMQLHDQALNLRRMHIINQTECHIDRQVPLLGCGPPPYDTIE